MKKFLLLLGVPFVGQGIHYAEHVTAVASTTASAASGTVFTIPSAPANTCSYIASGSCRTSTSAGHADLDLTKPFAPPTWTDAQVRFAYFVAGGKSMSGVESRDGSFQGAYPLTHAGGTATPAYPVTGTLFNGVDATAEPTVNTTATNMDLAKTDTFEGEQESTSQAGKSSLVEGPHGLVYNGQTIIDKDGGLINRSVNLRAAVDGYPKTGCDVEYPFLFNVASISTTGSTASLVGTTSYPAFPLYPGQLVTVRGLSSAAGVKLNGTQTVKAATLTSVTFSSDIMATDSISDAGTAGQSIHYPTQLDCAAATVSSVVIASGKSQDLLLGPETYPISQPIILPQTSRNATLSLDGVAQVRLYKGPSTTIQAQLGSRPFTSIVSYITVAAGGTGYAGTNTAMFRGTCTVQPTAIVSANKGAITKVEVTNPGQCSGRVIPEISGAGTGAILNTYMSQPMLYLPKTVGSLPNTLHISGVNFDANSIYGKVYTSACWDIYDIGYSYFQHMDCRNTGTGGDHDFAFGNPAELNQSVSQEVVVDDIQDEGTGNNEGEDAKFNVSFSRGTVSLIGLLSGGEYVRGSHFETLFYGVGNGLGTSPCTTAPTVSVVQTYGRITSVPIINGGTGCLAPVYAASMTAGGSGYVAATTKIGFTGANCSVVPAATPNVNRGIVVSLTFTNHGNCDGNPTITFTDTSGGKGAFATAAMALFMQAHQVPTTNYGGRFLTSDSTFKDVKIIGNFFKAGMTVEAGSNTIIHAHPQTSGGALYGAIYDAGYNAYFGTECDKVSPYCISFMGAGSMMSNTDLYYGSDPLDGASFAYFNSSSATTATGFVGRAATGIKLLGGTCYNSPVGGTSGWHLAMTSIGPLDTTQGTLPTAGNTFTDIESFNSCDTSSVNTFNSVSSPYTSITIQPFSRTIGPKVAAAGSGALRMVNGVNGSVDYRNAAGTSNIIGPYMDSSNVYHTYDDGVTQASTLSATIVSTTKLASATVCSASSSPAICGSAIAGAAVLPASTTTVKIQTTAVTPLSTILLTVDASLSSKLGVSCNTTPQMLSVSARSSGSSFTVTGASSTTNPVCFSYIIIN